MISESSHCHELENAELISVLLPADLSDSTLSYTETEAASSPNITPGEFSGGCASPTACLQISILYPKCLTLILVIKDHLKFIIPNLKQGFQFLREF